MKRTFCITLAVISIGLSCLAFAGETGTEDVKATGSQQEMTMQDSDEAAVDKKKDAKEIVAARVNGTDIKLDLVHDMLKLLQGNRDTSADTEADKETAMKNALDKAVFYELAYQKAVAGGMKVEPGEVDKKEAELTEKLGGAEALAKHLEEEGMTVEEMRTIFEKGIILRRIFTTEVYDKVVLTDEEIAEAYEKEKDKFFMPEKATVTDIVFFLWPEEAFSVNRVKMVLQKLLEDKDTNPYNLVPDGTFVAHDIELKKEKDPELLDAAKKLKVGEVSDVIKTSDSLHIIKLLQYSPEKQLSLDEVKGFLKKQLNSEKQQKISQDWEAELRKDAKIEIFEIKE